jgi:hypothetical protein
MSKLCVVGDLHGRLGILKRIVRDHDDYDFVFLGDILHHKHFFRRTPKVNPIRVIEYLMGLGDKAKVICGNNEMYILERLNFPLKDIRKSEARYTIQCLKEIETTKRLEILKWLINLPPQLEIGSYRFAHAMYNDPNPRLYGPGERWFEPHLVSNYPVDLNYVYFIGHYGKPYFYRNIFCIDCTELEGVGIWLTDKNLFKVYN